MFKKIICGLGTLGSFGFLLLGAADNAFVGTWKLNLANSSDMMFDNGKLVKSSEYADTTMVWAVEGETTTVEAHSTVRGQTSSFKFTVPTAGGPLNFIEGPPPAGITDVLKTVDNRTNDVISSVNGTVVLTNHVVVSANHKTLIDTVSGMDEKGIAFKTVEAFDRQ